MSLSCIIKMAMFDSAEAAESFGAENSKALKLFLFDETCFHRCEISSFADDNFSGL